MSKQATLFQQIEEQKKIIRFLQKKYKESTGYAITVPQTWQAFLGVKDDEVPIVLPEETEKLESRKYNAETKPEELTFAQALANLNLPTRISDPPKRVSSSSMPYKKKVQLSTNFQKFSRAGFRELLDSIVDMRCLNTLVLRNNGINDAHVEELETLFKMTRIKKIDLSQNEIDKAGAAAVGKLLKSEVTHINWIDLSRNYFSYDPGSVSVIVQGLKNQADLNHFALDVNVRQSSASSNAVAPSEVVTRLLLNHPKVESMALIDSRISDNGMRNVESVLLNPDKFILSLNFKYCFLEPKAVFILSRGLKVNRSLVQLNLSSNGLAPICGIYIIKSLKENICLSILDLSKNSLNDDFAFALAETLCRNDILWKVDISYNPINVAGAKAILKALDESNDTLESLGDISKNTSMGVIQINELAKALGVNKLSKEVKSKFMEEGRGKLGDDPKPLEQKLQEERNEEDFFLDSETIEYKLLKPVFLSNEIYSDPSDFRFWNI